MKKLNIYILTAITGLLGIVSSCTKDYTDPQKANEEQVFSSPKGLTGVAIGLQRIYTSQRPGVLFNSITANGFVSNELRLMNSGNIPELQLSSGGSNIDGTNSILNQLWSNSHKIIYDADLVISNAQNLSDKSYASGLIAYSTIFKALALGNLSTFWEQIPAEIGQNAPFIPRKDGYLKAIAAIDNALAVISANPIGATFLGNIPPGIDIPNTLHALKARYALFAGDYPTAFTSANNVDLTKRSVFNFDAQSLNPIFEISTSTNNVFQPIDLNMGLPAPIQPSPNDKRVPFYITPAVTINGFGAASTTPIPIYLPGEMILIKAEVYARQPNLGLALIELNKVVAKSPAADPFGVGADLPPIIGPLTQTQLLEQIYKHRAIELFMSGLRLEDMRRLDRPESERKRNFFPYPFTESDNNPNTPASKDF
ncbi:MAG: RagB/SusD family protein [Sphingobacteriaceae bacterium]